MSIFFTLERWLGEQAVPLVFIGFAILMGFVLLYFSAQSRRAALVRDRSGKNEDTFVEYLAAYGFDQGIARAAYRYLQQMHEIDFPILPKDDLDRDLGLDGDDLKQAVRDLLDETGRQYLPGLLSSPLVTVADLVRYIQASPRRVQVPRRRIA
jgi:hypothetical protein